LRENVPLYYASLAASQIFTWGKYWLWNWLIWNLATALKKEKKSTVQYSMRVGVKQCVWSVTQACIFLFLIFFFQEKVPERQHSLKNKFSVRIGEFFDGEHVSKFLRRRKCFLTTRYCWKYDFYVDFTTSISIQIYVKFLV
jgi:hypothetical protein